MISFTLNMIHKLYSLLTNQSTYASAPSIERCNLFCHIYILACRCRPFNLYNLAWVLELISKVLARCKIRLCFLSFLQSIRMYSSILDIWTDKLHSDRAYWITDVVIWDTTCFYFASSPHIHARVLLQKVWPTPVTNSTSLRLPSPITTVLDCCRLRLTILFRLC